MAMWQAVIIGNGDGVLKRATVIFEAPGEGMASEQADAYRMRLDPYQPCEVDSVRELADAEISIKGRS